MVVTRSRVRGVVHSIVRGVIVRVSRASGCLRRAIATRVTAGMPMRVASVFQHLSRLPAGWVPHRTIPEVEDAVMNKVTFPVGDTFLLHELDRKVFFDLRGGEVVAVEVFDKGDVRGGQKSMQAGGAPPMSLREA